MKIVRFGSDINRVASAGHFFAGVDYLLTDESLRQLEHSTHSTGFDLFAEVTDFTPENWTYPREIRSLLIYITGKIGDVLWYTALIRAIKRRMPEVKITVATQWPQLFSYNKDIQQIKMVPIPFASVQSFDAHLILEEPIASLTHTSQKNCYEELFNLAGVPFTINEARPVIHLRQIDQDLAMSKVAPLTRDGFFEGSMYHLILGLHSSSETRDLPVSKWVEILDYFHERYKNLDGFKIYGLSSEEHPATDINMALLARGYDNYVPLHNRLELREVAALARVSMAVITVDSMLAHLAAAVDAPTVAIMSTVPAYQRLSTYPFAEGVWNQKACAYAPCYWKRESFIYDLSDRIEHTPCYTPDKQFCDIASSVSMKQIGEAFNKVTARKEISGGYDFPALTNDVFV